MDPIASRVATRFAAHKSYKYDRARTNQILRSRNNPKAQQEERQDRGGYEVWKFQFVSVRDIIVPPIWSEAKAQAIRNDMDAGKALMPVRLHRQGAKWGIDDGIHRTNVSIERGFTHVPAFTPEYIETPEEMIPEPPEKPQLRVGNWVKLNKPYEGRSYGWVEEVLGPKYWRGVKRYMYGLMLVQAGDDWPQQGDFTDNEFEPIDPPLWAEKVKALIERAR
jgi:hypothetical protein